MRPIDIATFLSGMEKIRRDYHDPHEAYREGASFMGLTLFSIGYGEGIAEFMKAIEGLSEK